MNYYIRYNNQTLGPFPEQQIVNLLRQGRFDDSVRFSTDLSRWYSASEISTFRTIPLASDEGRSAGETSNARRLVVPQKQPGRQDTDHSLLYFFGFCLVVILGFAAIIYAINKDDADLTSSGGALAVENSSGNSLSSVWQKRLQAVGLVMMTFQNKTGKILPIPFGTAFAIGKNKFVTNAHVAYVVKNGYDDFFKLFVKYHLIEAAKEQGKSYSDFMRSIGERGFERFRTAKLEEFKKQGWKVRDIEIRLNHSNGEGFRVAKIQVHPRYNHGDETGEFDVAVFEISGRTDCFFEIASSGELRGLTAGTPVASAGFPMEGLENGDLNIDNPEATYATGVIKKITDFDNKDAGAQNNKSITHSIPAAGGASGSPIFTSNGKVVAVLWGVNHGFMSARGRIPSGLLHNKAVRIDQIKHMSEPVPWQSWINDPTKTIH